MCSCGPLRTPFLRQEAVQSDCWPLRLFPVTGAASHAEVLCSDELKPRAGHGHLLFRNLLVLVVVRLRWFRWYVRGLGITMCRK